MILAAIETAVNSPAATPGLDSQVFIALIAAIGGIVTTWLTVKYKDRIIKTNAPSKPKDRMETIFDGYEKLILQQQSEIERKGSVIESLENIIDNLERELVTTKELLATTKAEVAETSSQNIQLKDQLKKMRIDYKGNEAASDDKQKVV
ncbi:MAG: hypothetical protein WC426_13545 [Sulfuriferula sp.]